MEPATFPRVVKILGRLSEVKIDDNWANKPVGSLGSIFSAWMPQTAADHDMRLKAMRMLLEKHPAVGWEICASTVWRLRQPLLGNYAHKPKWRPDGYGFGEPFSTRGPINSFVREMVEIALTMPSYTVDMLCDLIARLHALSVEDQERVWKIIDEWRKAGACDDDIAACARRSARPYSHGAAAEGGQRRTGHAFENRKGCLRFNGAGRRH